MLDGGATKSFVLGETTESLRWKVINTEDLVIYAFWNENAKKRIYDIGELVLQNAKNRQ